MLWMTLRAAGPTMSLPHAESDGLPVRRARALLAVDVVEYTRLMECAEAETAMRWQAIVDEVAGRLVPKYEGLFVKSTGDGMVLEFDAIPRAVGCAIEMQQIAATHNVGLPEDRAMWLRIAAHCGDVYVNGRDVQGRAINLASRLLPLAGPGEIVLSAEARDHLVPGLDFEAVDMGECFFKHIAEPVRAYRLSTGGAGPAAPAPEAVEALSAGVAVLPFTARGGDETSAALGDLLADEVIGGLSRCEHLHVISRLSSAALAGRVMSVQQVGRLLRAAYVASGSFVVVQRRVRLRLELARTQDEGVIWSDVLEAPVEDVLAGTDEIVPRAVAAIGAAIVKQELSRSDGVPLPNLHSHSLLLASIGLIHRSSRNDFERAFELLDHLAQRHP